MDTMLTGILSETESEYDRYWYNMEFCSKLIEQQQEMERFVNESLIIASGNKQAIQEMYNYGKENWIHLIIVRSLLLKSKIQTCHDSKILHAFRHILQANG